MNANFQKILEFPGHKDAIYALCSIAGSNIFFSAGGDGFIVSWDLDKPSDPGKVIAQVNSSVYSLVYLEHKQQLMAGTRNGDVYLFDLINNSLLAQINLKSEIYSLLHLNETIYAGNASGEIYVLNEKLEILVSEKISQKSCRVIIPFKSGMLASGWSDHLIRILNISNLAVEETLEGHANSVFSLAFDKTHLILFSGGRDAHMKMWDAKGTISEVMSIPAHWYTVNNLKLSPDKEFLASASRDKTVKIWDTTSLKLLKVLDAERHGGHTHSVNILHWLNNHILISAGDDKKIEVWSLEAF